MCIIIHSSCTYFVLPPRPRQCRHSCRRRSNNIKYARCTRVYNTCIQGAKDIVYILLFCFFFKFFFYTCDTRECVCFRESRLRVYKFLHAYNVLSTSAYTTHIRIFFGFPFFSPHPRTIIIFTRASRTNYNILIVHEIIRRLRVRLLVNNVYILFLFVSNRVKYHIICISIIDYV